MTEQAQIFNPFLEYGFQKYNEPKIIIKDDDGNDIDITDYVAAINTDLKKKVNLYQGEENSNQILITDSEGKVVTIKGVVMTQAEREKLNNLTNVNSGVAIDVTTNNNINVRYDDFFGVTDDNRLTLLARFPLYWYENEDGEPVYFDNFYSKTEIDQKLENITIQKGDKGDDGENGKSAYQIWLDLDNTGTEQDFINSLKGNKGDKGDSGLNGDKGNDGENGKSAYQIWLDLGNTGTEQDFINSLKGEKGDKGDSGLNGADGANGKDAQSSGIDDTYFDISVSSWRELIRAVNFSFGYKTVIDGDNDSFVQEYYTTDSAIHKAGDKITKRGCRIHLQSQIDVTSNVMLDLSYCQIEGYNNAFNFTSSTQLYVSGNSAIFKNCRFYVDNYRSTSGITDNKAIINFFPATVNGGMNVIFEDCYFRDFWSDNKKYLYIAGNTVHKGGDYHNRKITSNNYMTINYKFYRCVLQNDSQDSKGRKLRTNNTTANYDHYLYIARSESVNNKKVTDSLENNSYKNSSNNNAIDNFTTGVYAHTGLFLDNQNSFNDYDINAVKMDSSKNASNRIVHNGCIFTSNNGLTGKLLDVTGDNSKYVKSF